MRWTRSKSTCHRLARFWTDSPVPTGSAAFSTVADPKCNALNLFLSRSYRAAATSTKVFSQPATSRVAFAELVCFKYTVIVLKFNTQPECAQPKVSVSCGEPSASGRRAEERRFNFGLKSLRVLFAGSRNAASTARTRADPNSLSLFAERCPDNLPKTFRQRSVTHKFAVSNALENGDHFQCVAEAR